MAKKATLTKFEQMIFDIASMTPEQLDTVLRCAKVALAQKRPKPARKPKAVQESKAS